MSRAAARAPITPRLGWDVLQVSLAVWIWFQIWRVQDLFPVLRAWGLPIGISVISVLLFLADRDPRRRARLRENSVFQIAVGILALVVLSVPGSLYPGGSIEFLLKEFWRSVALMLVLAGTMRGIADVERFVWVQFAGASVFCAVVLARFDLGPLGRLGELIMYDSNDLGLLIVCSLPLGVYLFSRTRSPIARVLVVLGTCALMLTLAKTGSRGGFLGLLAVSGYMVFRLRDVRLSRRVGAVAAVIVVLLAASTDRYWQMMQTMLHPTEDYNWAGNSDTGRMEIWKRGFGYMLMHPVLGVGADAFSTAEGTLAPEAALQEHGIGFKWSTAHNSLLQIGAELGVLGLVLFVALFVFGFRTLARVQHGLPGPTTFLARILTASLVGYAISGFFLSAAYWPYLYALLGMTVGLARVAAPAPDNGRSHGIGSRKVLHRVGGWRSGGARLPLGMP